MGTREESGWHQRFWTDELEEWSCYLLRWRRPKKAKVGFKMKSLVWTCQIKMSIRYLHQLSIHCFLAPKMHCDNSRIPLSISSLE